LDLFPGNLVSRFGFFDNIQYCVIAITSLPHEKRRFIEQMHSTARCIVYHVILPNPAFHDIIPVSRIFGHLFPPIVGWNFPYEIDRTVVGNASPSNECARTNGLFADIVDYLIEIKGWRLKRKAMSSAMDYELLRLF
jgi:hypothetical protein